MQPGDTLDTISSSLNLFSGDVKNANPNIQVWGRPEAPALRSLLRSRRPQRRRGAGPKQCRPLSPSPPASCAPADPPDRVDQREAAPLVRGRPAPPGAASPAAAPGATPWALPSAKSAAPALRAHCRDTNKCTEPGSATEACRQYVVVSGDSIGSIASAFKASAGGLEGGRRRW